MLLIFASCICCYIFTIESDKIKQEILLKGIEDTIFVGSFEVLDGSSRAPSVAVTIFSTTSRNNRYLDTKVALGNKQHFSFNLSEPDELVVRMVKMGPKDWVRIRFSYDTQFDTFNKSVAQKVVVRPAMSTLNGFVDLQRQVSDKTYSVAERMSKVRSEHKKSVFFVVLFSFLTMAGFVMLNYYQITVLRRFFKQKKLI